MRDMVLSLTFSLPTLPNLVMTRAMSSLLTAQASSIGISQPLRTCFRVRIVLDSTSVCHHFWYALGIDPVHTHFPDGFERYPCCCSFCYESYESFQGVPARPKKQHTAISYTGAFRSPRAASLPSSRGA